MNQNVFECAIRFLILLKNSNQPLSEYKLTVFDYMSTYGADFGITEYNLNGENVYRDSEFITRKQMASIAIKELVLRGMVSVDGTEGFKYVIAQKGVDTALKIDGAYSETYDEVTRNVLSRNRYCSEQQLATMINSFILEGKQ